MMRRYSVSVFVALWLVVCLNAVSASAQGQAGVVATYKGQFATAKQQDTIAFELSANGFDYSSRGTVQFVFLLRAVGGSISIRR